MQLFPKLLFCFLFIFSLSSCDAVKEIFGIAETEKSDIKDIFKDDRLAECVALLTKGLKAAEVRDIICANQGLTSIEGLEQFPNIRSLILNRNRLSQVDLSPYSNLEFLDLSANRVNEIDISHNPKLIEVFLDKNGLDELDTSDNPLLEALVLTENEISALDLSNNINLEELVLDQNNFVGDVSISALDLSQNIKLINLNLFENKITNIDLSNNVILDFLDMRKNELVSIDVSNNSNLSELRLNSNQLTELNVSSNENIDTLWAEDNLISTINLPTSSRAKLKFALLKGNQISCDANDCNGQNYFVFPRSSSFVTLDLSNNLISVDDLNFSSSFQFTELLLSDNPNLIGTIDLSLLVDMVEIRLDNTGITHIDLLGYTNYEDVFDNFFFQVITAIDAPLDVGTKNLLDDMQANRGSHSKYSDPSVLSYIYQ